MRQCRGGRRLLRAMPAACTSTCRPCCRRRGRRPRAARRRGRGPTPTTVWARTAVRWFAPSWTLARELADGVEQPVDFFHRRVAGASDSDDAVGGLTESFDHGRGVEVPVGDEESLLGEASRDIV